jgi:hypothetical protein
MIPGIAVVTVGFALSTTLTWIMFREDIAPRWVILGCTTLVYVFFATIGFYLIQDSWGAATVSTVFSLALVIPAGVGVSLGEQS